MEHPHQVLGKPLVSGSFKSKNIKNPFQIAKKKFVEELCALSKFFSYRDWRHFVPEIGNCGKVFVVNFLIEIITNIFSISDERQACNSTLQNFPTIF
jgi:hypothetical protein